MILVDSSVWIDHLRSGDATLKRLLEAEQVLAHPFIIGELSLGSLKQRDDILSALNVLPQAVIASTLEIARFIETQQLFGLGIGYVDVHLLASVRLTPSAVLWTRDKRLFAVADRLGIHARFNHS